MFLREVIRRLIDYPGNSIDLTWRDFAVEFFWIKRAGLVSVSWGRWAFHLGVRPSHWRWGYSTEDYGLCMDYWGVGPLFLFVRLN